MTKHIHYIISALGTLCVILLSYVFALNNINQINMILRITNSYSGELLLHHSGSQRTDTNNNMRINTGMVQISISVSTGSTYHIQHKDHARSYTGQASESYYHTYPALLTDGSINIFLGETLRQLEPLKLNPIEVRVDMTSPTMPAPIGPLSNEVITGDTTFTREASVDTGVGLKDYVLLLGMSPNPNSMIALISSGTTITIKESDLPLGTLYWTVVARDQLNNQSNYIFSYYHNQAPTISLPSPGSASSQKSVIIGGQTTTNTSSQQNNNTTNSNSGSGVSRNTVEQSNNQESCIGVWIKATKVCIRQNPIDEENNTTSPNEKQETDNDKIDNQVKRTDSKSNELIKINNSNSNTSLSKSQQTANIAQIKETSFDQQTKEGMLMGQKHATLRLSELLEQHYAVDPEKTKWIGPAQNADGSITCPGSKKGKCPESSQDISPVPYEEAITQYHGINGGSTTVKDYLLYVFGFAVFAALGLSIFAPGGNGKLDLVYIWLQKILSLFEFGELYYMRFIVRLIGNKKHTLAMDKLSFKIGKRHIHVLMVIIIYKGIGIPLLWKFFKNTIPTIEQRHRVLDRLLEAIPPERIIYLLCDREFFSAGRCRYLEEKKVPYIIRVKDTTEIDGKDSYELLKNKKVHEVVGSEKIQKVDKASGYLAAIKVPGGDHITVLSNRRSNNTAHAYIQRRKIKTMVGGYKKTEHKIKHDTSLTHIQRGLYGMLVGVVTIILIISYIIGVLDHGISRIFIIGEYCFNYIKEKFFRQKKLNNQKNLKH